MNYTTVEANTEAIAAFVSEMSAGMFTAHLDGTRHYVVIRRTDGAPLPLEAEEPASWADQPITGVGTTVYVGIRPFTRRNRVDLRTLAATVRRILIRRYRAGAPETPIDDPAVNALMALSAFAHSAHLDNY